MRKHAFGCHGSKNEKSYGLNVNYCNEIFSCSRVVFYMQMNTQESCNNIRKFLDRVQLSALFILVSAQLYDVVQRHVSSWSA